MRKVLSAEKLGISVQELLALLGVREALERNLIKHNPKPTRVSPGMLSVPAPDNNASCRFNMSYAGNAADCGTVACIGGWMALAMNKVPTTYVSEQSEQDGLYNLFYPRSLRDNGHDLHWSLITPKHAVKVIDHFLATGKADWVKAIGGREKLRKMLRSQANRDRINWG